jgi:myosin heavy subunit
VRCIKSNSERKPWVLDEASCTLQLRCAGMMEAVRIRKESFAYRLSIRDFLFRFTPLIRHPRSSSLHVPTEAGAEELAERSRLVADELAYTLGPHERLRNVKNRCRHQSDHVTCRESLFQDPLNLSYSP